MSITIRLILFLNLLVLGWSDVAVKITPPILELTEYTNNASFTCNIENYYGSTPIIEWYFKPFHANSTEAENGYFHFTISKVIEFLILTINIITIIFFSTEWLFDLFDKCYKIISRILFLLCNK